MLNASKSGATLEERLIPITYLRRNLGKILRELSQKGPYLVTKDSRIIAEIRPKGKTAKDKSKKTTAQKLIKFAGIWKGTELDSDEFWNQILTKDSKPPIKL